MATLLPPPKRQKVYHGIPEPKKEEEQPVPHVVVQFVAEDDGRQLAPAVNLPANVSRDALEALVNKLSTEVRPQSTLNHVVTNRIASLLFRTTIQSHSLSTSRYQQTKPNPACLPVSQSLNPSNLISLNTQHIRSHRRMSSSSTVPLNPSSKSVLQRVARLPSQVGAI